MNSVADMGGMHGFGPVRPEANEPLFDSDWERSVWTVGMSVMILDYWRDDESRYSMERMEPAHYLSSRYYEHWLHFLEEMLVEKGILTREELAIGHADPESHGSMAHLARTPEQYLAKFRAGGSIAMPSQSPQRFSIGDGVRARNLNPSHHTRLPRYVRGRLGVVHAVHGSFGFADTRAQGTGDHPQFLYSVRFEAAEVWGPTADGRDAVYIDLYDSYLEQAQ